MDPAAEVLSRTQRIVLLIDLHPLLQDPTPYISHILAAARRILSSPPLAAAGSLAAYRLFFSSLSPILSTSKVHRLTGKSPTTLSFDRPLQTLESLSETLNSLTAASGSTIPASPLAPLLARSLLQLDHDYAWEPHPGSPKGKLRGVTSRSNLVVLFSPLAELHIEAESDGESMMDYHTFSKKFIQNFGLVNERFIKRDIHLSWIDVRVGQKCKVDMPIPGFLEKSVRDLGWSFCTTDAVVLGSGIVPFPLIFPYISCSMGFTSARDVVKGRAELVLEIIDVGGNPLECKSCQLGVFEVKPSSKAQSVLSIECGSAIMKICIKKILRRREGATVVDSSCRLVLLQGISGGCDKDGAPNSSAGLFADRVLELLCLDKSEFPKGKPIWQLLLAFLYRNDYSALVSISDRDGNSVEGMLQPFTINYAMVSIIKKESLESFHSISGMYSGSAEMVDNSVSAAENKDGRRKRNKVKDITWSSFCEAAFGTTDNIDSLIDLEELYLSGDCKKSKKLRFLKCWTKQIKKSIICYQIKPHEQKETPTVKQEEDERVLDSQEELEEHVSSSSSHEGIHPTGPFTEEASSFCCLEDAQAFIGSIPKKIEDGLCSVETNLGNLAQRLVILSINAICIKLGINKMQCAPMEGGDNSVSKVADEVSQLLLTNPKDLVLKYKSFIPSPFTSEQSPAIYSPYDKVRQHELQILFRMEILRSNIGESFEENVKQKMVKEVCYLLRNIEFDLEGKPFCGESLLEFCGRIVKSRYSDSLGDVIHMIYNQMEFYSFDGDEIEFLSDSLPNSNSDDLKVYKDGNGRIPGNSIGLTIGDPSSQMTVQQQDSIASSRQINMDNAHEQRLVEAQEKRHKARMFSSFTSWLPDLHRVWALRMSRTENPIQEPPSKIAKRRKRKRDSRDMVCETPMTGKKESCVKLDDGSGGKSTRCNENSCRSLSKALFPNE